MKIQVVKRTKGELNLPLIYAAIGGFFGLYYYVLHLLNSVPELTCPFKQFLGIPCLTCGTTRSFLSLTELHILDAFLYNPLMFLLGLTFIAWVIYGIISMTKNKKLKLTLSPKESKTIRWSIITAVIINWTYLIIAGI